MSTINQLLKEKGTDVWSILPQESTRKALKLMAAKNVGALLVAENGQVVGIFSERDFARQAILQDEFNDRIPVSQLMTKLVVCVEPEQTIEECMEIMTGKRIRHLPVLSDDQIVGLISIGDVVNRIITEQKDTIHQLGRFISGAGYGARL